MKCFRVFLQEEAEWNELLQGGSAVEDNAGADEAPAPIPAEAAAEDADAGGTAEAAVNVGGELPLGQEGTISDATAAADQPGAHKNKLNANMPNARPRDDIECQ